MSRQTAAFALTALVAAAVTVDVGGQALRTFTPDWTFKGSALTGMQQLGAATWRAENGEIIGTPTAPEGGWLLLDKGYQDVQFAAAYRCAAGCTAGVMVRSEKSPDGTRGVYTLLSGDERSTAAVTVDAQGKITNREPLARNAGGQARFAPPLPAPGAAAAGAVVAVAAERGDEGAAEPAVLQGSCRCSRRRRIPLTRPATGTASKCSSTWTSFARTSTAAAARSPSTEPPAAMGRSRYMSAAPARPVSRTSRSRTSRAESRRPSRRRRASARSSSRTSITAGQPPRATSTTTASST